MTRRDNMVLVESLQVSFEQNQKVYDNLCEDILNVSRQLKAYTRSQMPPRRTLNIVAKRSKKICKQ